jgi:hypothetical protein
MKLKKPHGGNRTKTLCSMNSKGQALRGESE